MVNHNHHVCLYSIFSGILQQTCDELFNPVFILVLFLAIVYSVHLFLHFFLVLVCILAFPWSLHFILCSQHTLSPLFSLAQIIIILFLSFSVFILNCIMLSVNHVVALSFLTLSWLLVLVMYSLLANLIFSYIFSLGPIYQLLSSAQHIM